MKFQLTKLETERKHVNEMLKGRRNELTKAEEKMYEACGTTPYDVKLAKLTDAVESLQVNRNISYIRVRTYPEIWYQIKLKMFCFA